MTVPLFRVWSADLQIAELLAWAVEKEDRLLREVRRAIGALKPPQQL